MDSWTENGGARDYSLSHGIRLTSYGAFDGYRLRGVPIAQISGLRKSRSTFASSIRQSLRGTLEGLTLRTPEQELWHRILQLKTMPEQADYLAREITMLASVLKNTVPWSGLWRSQFESESLMLADTLPRLSLQSSVLEDVPCVLWLLRRVCDPYDYFYQNGGWDYMGFYENLQSLPQLKELPFCCTWERHDGLSVVWIRDQRAAGSAIEWLQDSGGEGWHFHEHDEVLLINGKWMHVEELPSLLDVPLHTEEAAVAAAHAAGWAEGAHPLDDALFLVEDAWWYNKEEWWVREWFRRRDYTVPWAELLSISGRGIPGGITPGWKPVLLNWKSTDQLFAERF